MLIEFTYLPEHNLYIRRFSGRVGFEQIVASIEEQIADSRMQGDVVSIEDVRDMDLDLLYEINTETLRRFKDGVHRFMDLCGDIKTAVIVDKTVQFGLVRQFGFLAEREGFAVRPFKTIEEARTFLDIPRSLSLPIVSCVF